MKNIILIFCIFSLTVSLFAQKTPVDAGNDTTVSLCPPGCANLKAEVVANAGTNDYKIDSIPYDPTMYAQGTKLSLGYNQTSAALPIGFTFCFFGNPYTQFYANSNGWIGFTPGQTTWSTAKRGSLPIPDATGTDPVNAIFAVWYGTEGGNVYYKVYGTAPYRKLVVTYDSLLSSAGVTCTNWWRYSAKIVLYETTNVIESYVYVMWKGQYMWNNSLPLNGIHGLHNLTGTKAVVIPGRNNTQWVSGPEGWRFTPIGIGSYTVNWYKTDTTSANKLFTDADTSLSHQVCPAATTTYIAQLISNSCPVDTFYDTVVVNTSGGAFPHTLSSSPPSCGKADGSVKITLTGGTPVYDYVWKDSLGNVIRSNFGTANTKDSIINLAAGKYYITANESGGCNAKDSATLISPSTPTPTITGGPLAFCQGDSITLDAGSGYTAYAWLSGQATQTITVKTSGTFSVIVTNASGCIGSASVATTVGSVSATVTPSAPICSGQTATLTATGGTGYTWINLATTNSVIYESPASTTTYSVIVSNGSCSDTAYSTVTVKPLPVITASPGTTLCKGDTATLTASGATAPYSWNTGPVANSIKAVTPSASYTVTSNGCTGSITMNFLNPPKAIAANTTICSGKKAILAAHGGVNYFWINLNTTDSVIHVSPTTNSTYSVIVSIGSCSDTAAATVFVNQNPNASIHSDETSSAGGSTTLTASGGGAYVWNNGVTDNPITVNPPMTTVYCVTVIDIANSCLDDTCITIVGGCSNTGELFMPNAFSPNYDGENDTLRIYYGNFLCIIEFHISIYDRWGEIVFQSPDPAFKWDGTQRGKWLDPAVFAYYLNLTFIDGTTIDRKGNISLIR